MGADNNAASAAWWPLADPAPGLMLANASTCCGWKNGDFDRFELSRRAEPAHEPHDRLFNIVEDGVHGQYEHQR
jgi:hypothetical protein